MIKIGINGFGRIGRLAFRIATQRDNIQVVGINDLLDVDYLAYMLKYDSVHGQFDGTVEVKDGKLIVNGNEVRITAERNPEDLKWDEIGAEYVIDATGLFKTKETAGKHLKAGAKKVIISAPSSDAPMFVMGVNHKDIKDSDNNKILNYQGNWRDIFQNWEALAHSYPEFIESMIHKFLNATTFDGYNPYRVTKDGFDWETIEPDDPWSYIGYWGDHQIIYLQKLLEISSKFDSEKS